MAEDQLMVEELQAALLAARSQLKQKDHDLEEAKTRLERLKTTAEIDQLHAMER
jgi:Tfp pilus assembly protein FimV